MESNTPHPAPEDASVFAVWPPDRTLSAIYRDELERGHASDHDHAAHDSMQHASHATSTSTSQQDHGHSRGHASSSRTVTATASSRTALDLAHAHASSSRSAPSTAMASSHTAPAMSASTNNLAPPALLPAFAPRPPRWWETNAYVTDADDSGSDEAKGRYVGQKVIPSEPIPMMRSRDLWDSKYTRDPLAPIVRGVQKRAAQESLREKVLGRDIARMNLVDGLKMERGEEVAGTRAPIDASAVEGEFKLDKATGKAVEEYEGYEEQGLKLDKGKGKAIEIEPSDDISGSPPSLKRVKAMEDYGELGSNPDNDKGKAIEPDTADDESEISHVLKRVRAMSTLREQRRRTPPSPNHSAKRQIYTTEEVRVRVPNHLTRSLLKAKAVLNFMKPVRIRRISPIPAKRVRSKKQLRPRLPPIQEQLEPVNDDEYRTLVGVHVKPSNADDSDSAEEYDGVETVVNKIEFYHKPIGGLIIVDIKPRKTSAQAQTPPPKPQKREKIFFSPLKHRDLPQTPERKKSKKPSVLHTTPEEKPEMVHVDVLRSALADLEYRLLDLTEEELAKDSPASTPRVLAARATAFERTPTGSPCYIPPLRRRSRLDPEPPWVEPPLTETGSFAYPRHHCVVSGHLFSKIKLCHLPYNAEVNGVPVWYWKEHGDRFMCSLPVKCMVCKSNVGKAVWQCENRKCGQEVCWPCALKLEEEWMNRAAKS